MSNKGFSYPVLLIGLVLALFLWLIPLRSELAFWRPPFVLLVVTYWLVHEPQYYGVFFAWMVGLFIDFLFGQTLGQCALAMSVAAYLVVALQRRAYHLQLFHQCLFVAFVVAAYELVLLSSRSLVDDVDQILPLFYPVLSSALVWPIVVLGLQKARGKGW